MLFCLTPVVKGKSTVLYTRICVEISYLQQKNDKVSQIRTVHLTTSGSWGGYWTVAGNREGGGIVWGYRFTHPAENQNRYGQLGTNFLPGKIFFYPALLSQKRIFHGWDIDLIEHVDTRSSCHMETSTKKVAWPSSVKNSTSEPTDSDYCATKFTIGSVLSVSASTILLIRARRSSLYCCQLICPDA